MQAALAALTPDLRGMIRSGAITYQQAQDMMFENNLFGGSPSQQRYPRPRPRPQLACSTIKTTATTAAATTSTTSSGKKKSLKVRSRGNQPDQDIHMIHAVNALGRLFGTLSFGKVGSGLLLQLPSDVLCPLLASLDIDELLYLGTTNRVWKSISRSDALWRRLYLARWKEPKPPAADADCPRYILNFYE